MSGGERDPRDPHRGRFTGDLDGAGWAPATPSSGGVPELPERKRHRLDTDERCPDCNAPVRFDTDGGGRLVTYERDWKTVHTCTPKEGAQ